MFLTEPQAKVSVHVEEVPKDLEEQVEDLHAQVCIHWNNIFTGIIVMLY